MRMILGMGMKQEDTKEKRPTVECGTRKIRNQVYRGSP
jgi:hypothetical protein